MEACDTNLSDFPNLIKVLIGTKCDLEYKRQVKIDSAHKLAEKYGMEASYLSFIIF